MWKRLWWLTPLTMACSQPQTPAKPPPPPPEVPWTRDELLKVIGQCYDPTPDPAAPCDRLMKRRHPLSERMALRDLLIHPPDSIPSKSKLAGPDGTIPFPDKFVAKAFALDQMPAPAAPTPTPTPTPTP